MASVTSLADAVLPLSRTRADVSHYSTANPHDWDMHGAIAILRGRDPSDHTTTTSVATAPACKRVNWMIALLLDFEADYFELDPVAFGWAGTAQYRG